MRVVFYALLSFSAPPPAGGEVFLTITLSGVERQKEERPQRRSMNVMELAIKRIGVIL